MLSMLPLDGQEKQRRGFAENALVFTAVERGQELGLAAAELKDGILSLDILSFPEGDSAVADGLVRAVLNAAMERDVLYAVLNAPVEPAVRTALYGDFPIDAPFSIGLFFAQLKHCKGG